MGKRLDEVLATNDVPLAGQRLDTAMSHKHVRQMLTEDNRELLEGIHVELRMGLAGLTAA